VLPNMSVYLDARANPRLPPPYSRILFVSSSTLLPTSPAKAQHTYLPWRVTSATEACSKDLPLNEPAMKLPLQP